LNAAHNDWRIGVNSGKEKRSAHFVVVGGGTAGWIAAFILADSAKRRHLDIEVSVV
jgi:NADH dehydrogenase FAD-containing subunit